MVQWCYRHVLNCLQHVGRWECEFGADHAAGLGKSPPCISVPTTPGAIGTWPLAPPSPPPVCFTINMIIISREGASTELGAGGGSAPQQVGWAAPSRSTLSAPVTSRVSQVVCVHSCVCFDFSSLLLQVAIQLVTAFPCISTAIQCLKWRPFSTPPGWRQRGGVENNSYWRGLLHPSPVHPSPPPAARPCRVPQPPLPTAARAGVEQWIAHYLNSELGGACIDHDPRESYKRACLSTQ